ncbi:MAG: hypothetical protein K0V04_21700 [Deltaproteobacteria bacterium]|nr:hypothetical protein [Deltaproteobacteria bacterium]
MVVSSIVRRSLPALFAVATSLGGCATAPPPTPPATQDGDAQTPPAVAAPAPASSAVETPAPATKPEPQVAVQLDPLVADILESDSIRSMFADVRVEIARRGPVRLRADGATLGLADGAAFGSSKRLRVVADRDHLRVVTEEAGVRLLLYVDRADARPVLQARAPLRPKPDFQFRDPPRLGHIVLMPGTWVEALEQTEQGVKVKFVGSDGAFSGWVDPTALGTTFSPGSAPAEVNSEFAALVTRRETKLLSKPGGRAITTLDNEDSVVPLTPKASNGYRLVEFHRPCRNEITYVGFVAAKHLRQPTAVHGYGCGSGSAGLKRPWGDAKSAPRASIEAGRVLLDLDGPAVVGCVERPTELADLGDGTYAVRTHWGPIPVRLAPESFTSRCGANQR